MLCVDRLVLGREKRTCCKLEHIVRSITEHHLFRRDAITSKKRLFELEPRSIGIACEPGEHAFDRPPRERAHADRVLVRGELDDVRLLAAHFARELRTRLTRL